MKTFVHRLTSGLVTLVALFAFIAAGAQESSTWEKIHATGKLRMGVTQAPP